MCWNRPRFGNASQTFEENCIFEASIFYLFFIHLLERSRGYRIRQALNILSIHVRLFIHCCQDFVQVLAVRIGYYLQKLKAEKMGNIQRQCYTYTLFVIE